MKRFLTKRSAVLNILLGAVIVLVGWSQLWVSLTLSSPEIRTTTLESTGQSSNMLPAGLALVAIATGLVLLTSRSVLAYVIAVINIGVATALTAFELSFLRDPVVFELKQLSALSGLSDAASLRSLVATIQLGPGIWITAAGTILIALGALAVAFGAHRWPARRSKYERKQARAKSRRADEPIETLDAWDEMTRGADPTS